MKPPRHRDIYIQFAADGLPRTTAEIGETLGMQHDLPGVTRFLRDLKIKLIIERSEHRLHREAIEDSSHHVIWTLTTTRTTYEEKRQATAQLRHRKDSTRKRRYR
jgi:hypothetical protein